MTTGAYTGEGFAVTFDASQYQTDSRKFGGIISNRMSMYIDNTPQTAVIKFTHNSSSLLFNEKKLDVERLQSRVNKDEADNNLINNLDSHFRLLTAESNARPTSSNVSDRIDLGATQPINSRLTTPQTDNKEEDVQLTEHNQKVISKSSSRKGKRKKRAKSSRGLRSRSTQGKNGGACKQSTPVATKVKHSVIQNDAQNMTTGVAGLGVLESMCKPMVLHKTLERKNSEKKDLTKTVSSTNRQTIQPSTKQISLPQMTNNFMVKTDTTLRTSVSESLQSAKSVYSSSRVNHAEIARITKIYLSEKQSGVVRDCGMEVPCAPPATPLPDPSKKVEYIPSMNDIRAQRAVKVKLQVLEKEAQKRSAKRRDDQAKQEKQQQKEREKDLKVKQRIEIYALNKIMTELENKRFKEFCEKKGISIT
ncbi:uncharacterized protein LOC133205574 isoform X2 [Saccostrea echinata]|uniref:uncharacterized protein LOC133205574 isoform X2 n=1 Tax=Saccostrea echinata TaxID=191078 RepID=UPI002A7F6054|nr:uncharacterized protein LOC133205574 isoform X2 [Saccostrea echinata]